jgi:hypothetical protein
MDALLRRVIEQRDAEQQEAAMKDRGARYKCLRCGTNINEVGGDQRAFCMTCQRCFPLEELIALIPLGHVDAPNPLLTETPDVPIHVGAFAGMPCDTCSEPLPRDSEMPTHFRCFSKKQTRQRLAGIRPLAVAVHPKAIAAPVAPIEERPRMLQGNPCTECGKPVRADNKSGVHSACLDGRKPKAEKKKTPIASLELDTKEFMKQQGEDAELGLVDRVIGPPPHSPGDFLARGIAAQNAVNEIIGPRHPTPPATEAPGLDRFRVVATALGFEPEQVLIKLTEKWLEDIREKVRGIYA